MQNISQGVPGAEVAQSKSEMVQFKAKLDGLRQRLQGGDVKEKELRKACQDFEAVFIGKLWEQMRNTIPESDLLHSKQEKMYLSMFDRAFSEKMAESGGIGLQDMMYEQLKEKLDKAGRETLPSSLGAPNEVRPLADAEGVRIKSLRDGMDHTLEGRGGQDAEPVFDSEPAEQASFGEAAASGAESVATSGATSGAATIAGAGQAEINRKVDELAMRIQMEASRNTARSTASNTSSNGGGSARESGAVAASAAGMTGAESAETGEAQVVASAEPAGPKAPTRSEYAMARAARVYDDINAESIVARLAGNLQRKP